MASQLMTQYQQVQQDEDLLNIREDIHLQDTLLRGALEAMSRGEAGELWVKLKETWKEYQKAKRAPLKDREHLQDEALYMVGFLITEGYQEYMARIELRQMLQERLKLVEGESRRLERISQSLTVNQAMSLAQALVQAVMAHVNDDHIIARIQADFLRLVNRPNAPNI